MNLSYLSLSIAVIAISPSSCVFVDGSSSSTCCAFVSIPFLGLNQANPEITQHAFAQESTLLKINLDIAQEVNLKNRQQVLSGDRLGIEGLTIELKGREGANYKHPNLPGANGPNPQLSSGAKTLNLTRKGKFVDLTGTRLAHVENGAWEIIWRNNAKAGSLICGFDVMEAIQRHDAVIPKGRLYMVSINKSSSFYFLIS